jgi:hypothetical protein
MVAAFEPTAADKDHEFRLVVVCLRCGWERVTLRSPTGHFEPAECPACQDVGWRHAELARQSARSSSVSA